MSSPLSGGTDPEPVPVLVRAAPRAAARVLTRWQGAVPAFCCVLAHTDTCLIPGLSAAGTSEAIRPKTPAADAEAVWYGRPRCLPFLPSNPLGPPGPAAITRAAVQLGRLPVEFVATGLRCWPDGPVTRVAGEPGTSIVAGQAVPHAAALFEAGLTLGPALAARGGGFLVLGESVPGGTTTALALLLALGVPALGRVSGSIADNAHPLKERVALAALAAAGLGLGDGVHNPLRAAAAVGDPMQPLAAGIAVGAAAAGGEVLLAGGSQMVAVAALAMHLGGADVLARLAVATTRWVSDDPAADVPGLARDVSPDLPLLAANLDFSQSRHVALHAYEQFLVKEGVGAGGACVAALLATDASLPRLHDAIDRAYDEAFAGLSATGAWQSSR